MSRLIKWYHYLQWCITYCVTCVFVCSSNCAVDCINRVQVSLYCLSTTHKSVRRETTFATTCWADLHRLMNNLVFKKLPQFQWTVDSQWPVYALCSWMTLSGDSTQSCVRWLIWFICLVICHLCILYSTVLFIVKCWHLFYYSYTGTVFKDRPKTGFTFSGKTKMAPKLNFYFQPKMKTKIGCHFPSKKRKCQQLRTYRAFCLAWISLWLCRLVPSQMVRHD